VENEDNALLITLPEPILAASLYTMNVPEAFFAFDWWERDCSALTFTWSVTGTLSVTMISGDGQQTPVIYDLQGRRINATIAGDLAKGIYIINGKKVVIR